MQKKKKYQRINIWVMAKFRIWFKCLSLIRENLLTKISGSKHARFCSNGSQLGVTWQEILIKCVQLQQICPSNRVTLEVYLLFQIGHWWTDQRDLRMNAEQKNIKVFSSPPKLWMRCSDSCNNPVILFLNRLIYETCFRCVSHNNSFNLKE